MRAIRWALLPLVVIGAAVLTSVAFFHVYQRVMDSCTRQYAVDFDFCPAPWAPAVFAGIFCFGSAFGGALCIVAAHFVAPSVRHRTVRIVAAGIAVLVLYLFFLHWWWQLLFAIIAAIITILVLSPRHARLQPHT